jgi:Fe-S-cluster-containing hydrogenase component 2
MRSRGDAVVVICGDLVTGPVPIHLGELAARLRRELSGAARVLVVPEICEAPGALAETLAGATPTSIVVGCRAALQLRGELRARLRRAGIAANATEVVDLTPAEGCTEDVALEQYTAVLSAALARVVSSDATAPVRERTSLSVASMSRRSLLSGVNRARHFVAVWRPGRCVTGLGCTACVQACPHGALRRESGRVVVDGDRCNGCGVCVAACSGGSFALPGAEIEAIGAALTVLVAAIRRGGPAAGIAVTCSHAEATPRIGGPWLKLCVPSLEMVTTGWLLQLTAVGVGVWLIACGDSDCAGRAMELDRFARELTAAVGLGDGGQDTLKGQAVGASDGFHGEEPRVVSQRRAVPIVLGEPRATTQALAALGAFGAKGPDWRAEGPCCSLGSVQIDAEGCSLCEVCVAACPTEALRADTSARGSLRLSFDARRCTGCGACAACCPEKVITVQKVAHRALLAGGRRVIAAVRGTFCNSCGAPLVGGLSAAVLHRRLGVAVPEPPAGPSDVCADCRLGGRSVKANRRGLELSGRRGGDS